MPKKSPMNPASASKIQSTQAKAAKPTGTGSFPARAQSAAATNVNKGIVPAVDAPAKAASATAGSGSSGRKSPKK